MDQAKEFVAKARKKGLSDEEIKNRLLAAGWQGSVVYAVVEDDPDLIPPPAPRIAMDAAASQNTSAPHTVNVVNSGYSAAGFEYLIYFVSVGIVALAFGGILHNIVSTLFSATNNYAWYSDIIPIAIAALMVALPIMLYLMVRLGKKERQQPDIVNDPSRRRAVQLLMLITFIVGVVKLISYVYGILTPADVYDTTSMLEETLHAMVTIGIAGGVFVNYWRKQSKLS